MYTYEEGAQLEEGGRGGGGTHGLLYRAVNEKSPAHKIQPTSAATDTKQPAVRGTVCQMGAKTSLI